MSGRWDIGQLRAAIEGLTVDEQLELAEEFGVSLGHQADDESGFDHGRLDAVEEQAERTAALQELALWEQRNGTLTHSEYETMHELVLDGHDPDDAWDMLADRDERVSNEDLANEIADSAERQLGRELTASEWKSLGEHIDREAEDEWRPLDTENSASDAEDYINERLGNFNQPSEPPAKVFNLDDKDDTADAIDALLAGHNIEAVESGDEPPNPVREPADFDYQEPSGQHPGYTDADIGDMLND
jgi:hypothetical protein